MTGCGEIRPLLGSYVLGGLERDEVARVERHLQACPDCREAHRALAPVPALLDVMAPGPTLDPGPSPRLERSVLAEFAAQHDAASRQAGPAPRPGRLRAIRWRVALPSGLVGAAATVAVLALAGVFSSPPATGEVVTLSSPTGGGRTDVRAQLIDTPAGTEVELAATLPPLRRGEVYELWFVRHDGRLSAGTFVVDGDGRVELRLTTAARVERYERLGITREPDGLDPARNGSVVAVGRLPG